MVLFLFIPLGHVAHLNVGGRNGCSIWLLLFCSIENLKVNRCLGWVYHHLMGQLLLQHVIVIELDWMRTHGSSSLVTHTSSRGLWLSRLARLMVKWLFLGRSLTCSCRLNHLRAISGEVCLCSIRWNFTFFHVSSVKSLVFQETWGWDLTCAVCTVGWKNPRVLIIIYKTAFCPSLINIFLRNNLWELIFNCQWPAISMAKLWLLQISDMWVSTLRSDLLRWILCKTLIRLC